MTGNYQEHTYYYTETGDNRKTVRLKDITDKSLVKAEYQIHISSTNAENELRLTVPEEINGCTVGRVVIYYVIDEHKPPRSDVPVLSYIYLPAGVSDFHINKSLNQYHVPIEIYNLLHSCTIEVSPDNPYLCAYKKGLYSKDMSELYYIFSPDEEFAVPVGVKRIKQGAAEGLKGLKRLVVPEGVTEIEYGAFQYCADLEEAEIHAESIGQNAFFECRSLASVRLDCKRIDSNAFFSCRALRYAELMNTEPIGSAEVFFLCGAPITELKLPDDDPDYCIYENGLYSRDMTELYYIFTPEEGFHTAGCFEVPKGVRVIRPFAGRDLAWLRRLIVPEGVLDMGMRAFLNCTHLEEADIHAAAIGEHSFHYCRSLSKVWLDCKLIGDNAFGECVSLNSVELANTEVIEPFAFNSCHQLTNIKLPDTLLRIKHNAFYETKITCLRIPPSVIDLGHNIMKTDYPTNITLELYLKDGTLPIRSGSYPAPVSNGALIVVRDPETDEILVEFIRLGDFDTIFTKNGIDFTEYDKNFNNDDHDTRFTDEKKLLAAFKRLQYPIGVDDEKREFFKNYIAEKAALMLIEEIKQSYASAETIGRYQYYEHITDEWLLKVIDESANAGKTEITAMLMQILHERKSHGEN